MAETDPPPPLEQTVDEATVPADATAARTPDAGAHALFERLGAGGMGEVYRCGDAALGRDLAIKVLRPELHGDAAAERRFLREARLTGSLQHPGIVPVHHLGRLADGRPCYTMKLVRGRTLAELLRDEPGGPERLPRLLAVLEKVCQAVAYAHSRGVIHRDLKPANVMVGEFGEVQVMDWGLAKELRRPGAPEEELPAEAAAPADAAGADLSRAGAALGTPAYMPPEQAAGDWGAVDERADVFSLGAMLCELLTGRPPYGGSGPHEVLRRARGGDVAEGLARLEPCGADAQLVELCRECLAAERERRPQDAGAVAARLASYQAEVRERLRRAELERARAEVEARERRKRRRLAAALALAGLLLLAGGAAVWWQGQRRQTAADGATAVVLGEARLLRQQARADPLAPAGYEQAVAAARNAAEMAHAGGASAAVRGQADDRLADVRREAEAAAKDRRLLARLLEVRGPREGLKYARDGSGAMTVVAEPTADEQFAAAFRAWGLGVDATPAAEAAARLRERPAAVRTEMIAALDEWSFERRQQGQPEAAWRRPADLAAAADDAPDSLGRELRALRQRGRLGVERVLGMLSAALRPVPVPVVLPLGEDRGRLRQLAAKVDPAAEPLLGLVTLARALRVAGEEALAERLLREAIQARPREVVLYHTLGQLLQEQDPPRWAEAVECYAAARALRPDLGISLATALRESGRQREGLGLLARMVKEDPDNPALLVAQGRALRANGDLDGAAACYRKALALDPRSALFRNDLGIALYDKGVLDGAIACYRKTIGLDPRLAAVHVNLGLALQASGDLDGAIACYRKALELEPHSSTAYNGLGNIRDAKGDLDGALACFRKAMDLDPKCSPAFHNVGWVLQRKGDLDGAIAGYRRALVADPANAHAQLALGNAVMDKGDVDGCIACCQKVLALGPRVARHYRADALYNLGRALHQKRDLDGAVACYRRALALDPHHAHSFTGLGNVLDVRGDPDGAITFHRKAIEANPKLGVAYSNLAGVLSRKDDWSGAIPYYRKAIELDPDNGYTLYYFGQALWNQGRWEEALPFLKRGNELASKRPDWNPVNADWPRRAEERVLLARKLPAVLRGEVVPTPHEAAGMAAICLIYRQRYATAARLYAGAFAAEPKLAADRNEAHRYNAACAAARASAGQGEDARLLPDKARAMFRRWALAWLRAEVHAYAELAGRGEAGAKPLLVRRLSQLQHDPDLEAVRDPQALARLPEWERVAWQALWYDITDVAGRLPPQAR